MCRIENVVRSNFQIHVFDIYLLGTLLNALREKSQFIEYSIYSMFIFPMTLPLFFFILFFADKCVNTHDAFSALLGPTNRGGYC